ncbi:adenylate kinase family protein [Methanobacterium alcaliphilum]|uniref:adenylate kinase family protein n=1 Tax=Methanobacterium alcaliphilum TaxID=392018 RepID=UPI00200AACBA|nr:adenylate kinase family protein [Methanobacterium alcaliphilum]MCK9152449.1 adenylate kinase family protein [Methanobacterium alcaliphilum]
MKKSDSKTVIFITGTPGVGKTTIASCLKDKISSELVKINEFADEKGLFLGKDREKGYNIIDLDKLSEETEKLINQIPNNIILEGHLSHFCSKPDIVIVLRLQPAILESRLMEREYSSSKVNENLEAEALGICASEAYQIHGDIVQEIDTSNLTVEEVLDITIQIIKGKKRFKVGNVDFLDWVIS